MSQCDGNNLKKQSFISVIIRPGKDPLIKPRFIALSKSADERSLFLETFDGRLLESIPFKKGDLFFKCERVFRTKNQFEQEIKIGEFEGQVPDFVEIGGKVFYPPLYEFFDIIRYSYLKFWKRPLWQSFLWITLCSTSLCLNKSSFKSKLFLLLATAGALLVSNRKFLLNYMNDVLNKKRFNQGLC